MEMIRDTILEASNSLGLPRKQFGPPLDFPRFEDIPPFGAREGVIYVSQPVFVGTDVAITLTPTGMTVETRSDHAPDRSWASALCMNHANELQTLAAKIFAKVGGDAVRLKGKLVRPYPAVAGFIDIHRTLIFDAETCILEYPYQEQIFEEDTDRIPRFITLLADDAAQAIHALARDATSAVIRSNILDEREPVRFKGLFWIPVSREGHRPGFFIPYEPDRFSELEARDWMKKVHRREFRDIIHVDHLNGIGWP